MSKGRHKRVKPSSPPPPPPPRARPSRAELEQMVEEYALNAYRMQAGRNIDVVAVKWAADMTHPYARVLMNPVGDFFPRALAVLAHATLEATVRNILKLIHPAKTPSELESAWSASSPRVITRVYSDLADCGVQVAWNDPFLKQRVESDLISLVTRRNRIAHHADMPSNEQDDINLFSRVLSWCHAAVTFEAVVITASFPELGEPGYEALAEKIELVQTDWAMFSAAIDPPQPGLALNVGMMLPHAGTQ